MKAPFLALATACVLFVATAAAAQGPHDKDFNYGYPKNHKVTAKERERWEKEHHDDRHDDRRDKDFNYGYPKNHKVTPQERERWEREHRNDHR